MTDHRDVEERLSALFRDAAPRESGGGDIVINGRDGLTIVGHVGRIIQCAAPQKPCWPRPVGLRDVEWRRSIYRDIRQRLARAPHVGQSFGHWLSSVHGAADMTELDDDTLEEAQAWVAARSPTGS